MKGQEVRAWHQATKTRSRTEGSQGWPSGYRMAGSALSFRTIILAAGGGRMGREQVGEGREGLEG